MSTLICMSEFCINPKNKKNTGTPHNILIYNMHLFWKQSKKSGTIMPLNL